MNDKPIIPSSSYRHRVALNRLGIVVLLIGIGSAIIIYWSGQVRSARQFNQQGSFNAEGGWKDGTLPPEDTKRFSRDVEMYYGKVGLLVVKWQLCWTFPGFFRGR